MTDETAEPEEKSPKGGGKKMLLIGLVAAVLLGGGSFYAVYSGLILGDTGAKETASHSAPAGDSHGAAGSDGDHGDSTAPSDPASIRFVSMDPIMVSLPPDSSAKHLRFTGSLEVHPGQEPGVREVMPRVLDVLNTYLRAVDVKDIEQPSSTAKLRAQMLRRIQVVTGEGIVRDLLVTEFVLY